MKNDTKILLENILEELKKINNYLYKRDCIKCCKKAFVISDGKPLCEEHYQ